VEWRQRIVNCETAKCEIAQGSSQDKTDRNRTHLQGTVQQKKKLRIKKLNKKK
jgi:hypothetical protein